MASWTSLAVLSALAVSALSLPGPDGAYDIPDVGAGRRSQYFVLHNDGTYKYGHDTGEGAFESVKLKSPGNQEGEFGYRDPDGNNINLQYRSGEGGFVARGNHLPVPHPDFDAAHAAARARSPFVDPLADSNTDASYNFQFAGEEQTRTEQSDADGNVRGSYTYTDEEGITRTFTYSAGRDTGFVIEGSDLPQGSVESGLTPAATRLTSSSNRVASSGSRTVGTTSATNRRPSGGSRFSASNTAATSSSRLPSRPIGAATRSGFSGSASPQVDSTRSDASYSFAYNAGDHSRSESADANLNVAGQFSFVADDGVQRSVTYESGANRGFQATGDHLPTPPDAGFGNRISTPQSQSTYRAPSVSQPSSSLHSPSASRPQSTFQAPRPQVAFQAPRPQSTFQTPKPQPAFPASRPQSTFQAPRPQSTFQAPHPQAAKPQPAFPASRPQPTFQAPRPQSTFQAPRPQSAIQSPRPQSTFPTSSTRAGTTFSGSSSLSSSLYSRVPFEEANTRSELRPDGSYAFGYETSSHSRAESGDSDNNVDGKFDFVADDDGQRREIKYEAGSDTGFIAEGAHIPVGPEVPGAPSGQPTGRIVPVQEVPFVDPLADTGLDASYNFAFDSEQYSRSEVADSEGNVQGSYTVVEDDGTRRTFRFRAGKGVGFETEEVSVSSGPPPARQASSTSGSSASSFSRANTAASTSSFRGAGSTSSSSSEIRSIGSSSSSTFQGTRGAPSTSYDASGTFSSATVHGSGTQALSSFGAGSPANNRGGSGLKTSAYSAPSSSSSRRPTSSLSASSNTPLRSSFTPVSTQEVFPGFQLHQYDATKNPDKFGYVLTFDN